jgi:hypothetical protein
MKRKLIVIGMVLTVVSMCFRMNLEVGAQSIPEYQKYVHNFSNWTYVEKPMFPVMINESQILVGQNWSIICPLTANHTYHAYLYGDWVNNGSEPKTDYDIYVYGPNGTLEGYHTESAGLPEHLGDTADSPYFTPRFSGNYTFVIANNAGSSKGAQQATFMLIEAVDCNVWHEQYIQGRNGTAPVFNTAWAFEFVSDSPHVEVVIKVPDTLDAYEARLFLMADSTVQNETLLNDVPLAWELGLYGNRTGTPNIIGGNNLDSEGYRGAAYASCEYYGQDMLVNFTSPHTGRTLYHLALMGEYGSGTVQFLIRTMFNVGLQPSTVPGRVYLDNNATVAYTSKSTDLVNASLQYSVDGWAHSVTVPMTISYDRTCSGVIPRQTAGTLVLYRVTALDYLDNLLAASGNYTVRQLSVTFLEKPMFPVQFNDSQIEIGRDWSIVCPLKANVAYHVYLYGAWVNSGSDPKTDYDIYVYNPSGVLEGYHTESAGLPEHLGDTVDAPFFTAKFSGNYTFIISNDAGESNGAEAATFMIIEDANCNVWHEQCIQGGNGTAPVFNTAWAFEFVSDSQHVEVWLRVPETLDMYEARLFLMADPTVTGETVLNGVPLAWELGLYGRKDGIMGGYNVRTEGYRGAAFASCEYYGEDMLINFTSSHAGLSLYHLVLIGEKGSGIVQFLVKTSFGGHLQPSTIPGRVYLDANATITYVSQSTDLLNATLQYSVNNWATSTAVGMLIVGNKTCTATIPGQAAGTVVCYRVTARDYLENILVATGNYTVRQLSVTFLEKPMFPVQFNDSQIEIGLDWSVVCPLRANRTYHIYLYGAWVNSGSDPKTDYDIYVYNPSGVLEGYHTESAGLPEHLGDTVDAPFFTAKFSGNYTFIIANNAGSSKAAEAATFMIMENVECNLWHDHYIEGKDGGNMPVFDTAWAFEFVSDSQHVEVLIKVADTLDMYEARLFLMADPTVTGETVLNGVPLAWELGLYGNRGGTGGVLGGYNIKSELYRGVAFASCEYYGEEMHVNFTSPHAGRTLYHLVFIGEYGAGKIRFQVKTVFDAALVPLAAPGKVYPNDAVTVAYVSKSTDLFNASLEYSTDEWTTLTSVSMTILDKRTCSATIPRQAGDTFVSYRVEADDYYENILVAYGNYTVISSLTILNKPVYPVFFARSQIEIGRDWSIVCPLKANHSYHVYLYGDWVNNGSEPRTNYDVYVYDPYFNPEGKHAASAGLLEHLGDTVDYAFFNPKHTGNYTFVIVNDAGGSRDAQEAAFMIIEDVQCNIWHEQYVEGKSSGLPVYNTTWAYEFYTDNPHVEVYVNVPDTLTVYEVRLYLMADPTVQNVTILNGVPLAWEPGLHGNRTGKQSIIGGYNLESEGYRGAAYASCENFGQDMLLNFTSPNAGRSLYHLVLIGGKGSGTVEFLVKTVFDAALQASTVPGLRIYPGDNVTLVYVSKSTDLVDATLQYSVARWANTTSISMELVDNRTCRVNVPGQAAGTNVVYGVVATDILRNVLVANGSYNVKMSSSLSISLARQAVTLGENITVTGNLTPVSSGMPITLYFLSGNESETVIVYTVQDGSFTASHKPAVSGEWSVQARFFESDSMYTSITSELPFQVDEPSFFAVYSLYIVIGAGGSAAAAVAAVVFMRKWRRGAAEAEW